MVEYLVREGSLTQTVNFRQYGHFRKMKKNKNKKKYRYFIHDSLKESHTEYKKSYETLWRRGILMILTFGPKVPKNVFWDISTKNTFESKINLNLVANDVFNLRNEFHAIPTIF